MTLSTSTTFVSCNDLGFSNLSADLPRGLFRSGMSGGVDFLICTAEQPLAVCLEHASGFSAWELEAGHSAWHGCHIGNVELQADISSAFTDAEHHLSPGDLVIENGHVCVAAKPVQLGHLPRLVRWGDAAQLGTGVRVGGFKRWRIIRVENNLPSILKEIGPEI